MINSDLILKSFDDIILILDENLIFTGYYCKDESVLFVRPEAFMGKSVPKVFPNDFGKKMSQKVLEVFKTKQNRDIVYLSPNKSTWYKAKLNLIHRAEHLNKNHVALIISECTEEVKLQAQKSIFENIVSQNWDSIVFANLEGMIEYVNEAANRMYGYEGEELIGQNVDIFNSQKSHDTGEIIQAIIDTGMWAGEITQIKKDKTIIEAFLSVQLIKDKKGVPIGYASHSKDISKQKETAKKLKNTIAEKEELLKEISIFENIVSQNWDSIVFANLEGTIEYINSAANRMYGYEGEELIGQNVDIFNSQKSHDTGEIIQAILDTGMWAGEITQIKKDKTIIETFLSIQLIKDKKGEAIGYASHSKDISEKKETAQKLKKIIGERETLLKEIHHRVKNNLQVITSLLSLQSNTIEDEKTKNLFQQSQYRINAMATIHESLYQTDDFLTIGYNHYLKALGHYLLMSMKGENNAIGLKVDAEDVKLNIDTAIPLGLLINEIITNALKYGIKGNHAGQIYIDLKEQERGHFLLNIGDDGVGYSDEINHRTSNSLGMKLIHSLTRQLRGSIEKDKTRKGTHYIIHFQEID